MAKIVSTRGVQTGPGKPDYFVYTLDDGRTFYNSADISRNPADVIGIPIGQDLEQIANQPAAKSSGTAKAILDGSYGAAPSGLSATQAQAENAVYQSTGQPMSLSAMTTFLGKGDAFAKNITDLNSQGLLRMDSSGNPYADTQKLFQKNEDGTYKYLATDANGAIVDNEFTKNLKDKGLLQSADFLAQLTQANNASQQAKTDANKYTWTPSSDFLTAEQAAQKTVNAGAPTLDASSVQSWQNQLEPMYAPVRDKLKTNMADYWASLFPQGGGTGTQATNNIGQLNDLETNKLNTALGFAQTDLTSKNAQYQSAQNLLSGLEGIRTQAGQFGSAQDAAAALQQAQLNAALLQSQLGYANQNDLFNKQANLQTYLAQATKPAGQDPWLQYLSAAGNVAGAVSKFV